MVALSALVLLFSWLSDALVVGLVAIAGIWLLAAWDFEKDATRSVGNSRDTYMKVVVLASVMAIAGQLVLVVGRSDSVPGNAATFAPAILAAGAVLLAGRMFHLRGFMAHVGMAGMVYVLSTFGFAIGVILVCQCM